jgi:hypothetical protein
MVPPYTKDKTIQQHNAFYQRNLDFRPTPHNLHPLDTKIMLDILAVGQTKDGSDTQDTGIPLETGGNLWSREEYLKFILRGVEIKVTRNDFLSGFCASGCNYHYVLTPMRLINKDELPDHVGLLEFNKHKFYAKWNDYEKKWELKGVRLVKRPRMMEVPERNILTCVVTLTRKASWKLHNLVSEEIANINIDSLYE